MQKKWLAVVVSSVMASQAMAIEVLDDGTKSLEIGGRIGVQTETKKGKTNPDNDSARINFKFEHQLAEMTTGFAVAEWGYKPKNEYYSEDGEVKTNDLFSNRLGYLGIKGDLWGAVAVGKQDSVYGDIANWTNEYAIGGGEALGLSNGFTSDGGFSGTDRADDAVTYRGSFFDGLDVGVQYQMRGESYNKDRLNLPVHGDVKRKHGYQLAVSYAFDMGVSLGVSHNETNFEASPEDSQKEDLTSKASVAAIKYNKGDVYVAAAYGQFQNHTAVSFGKDTASAPAENMGLDKKSEGIELYGRYRLSQILDGGISLETGWNQLKVKDDNQGNKSDAKTDKVMVGAIYEIGPMQFAAEYTWDQSKIAEKVSEGSSSTHYKNADNYFNLQARYYF